MRFSHVAAWAIGVFVEFPGRGLVAIQGGDEEAAALFVSGLVFDLGDDAPGPGPGSGFGDVVEIAVGADRLAGFDHGYGGLAADPLCFLEQDIVARQAEDVIHGISFAPTHQVLAREAAVAAQQDVDVGPTFADHPRRCGGSGCAHPWRHRCWRVGVGRAGDGGRRRHRGARCSETSCCTCG